MFLERFSKMFKKSEKQVDIQEDQNTVSDDGEKRLDNKGRVLQIGESQSSDGRYRYQYTGRDGKRRTVYAWRLIESDETPYGKRQDKCLREKERDVLGDKLDGEKRFLYQVIDKTGLISNVYTIDGEHFVEELDLHLRTDSLPEIDDFEGLERMPTIVELERTPTIAEMETPANGKISVSYNNVTDSINFSTECTRTLESDYAKMLVDSKNKNVIKIVACDMSDKLARRWQRLEYVNGNKGRCRTWTSKTYTDVFKKCEGIKNTRQKGKFYFCGEYNPSDNSLVFDLSKVAYTKGPSKEKNTHTPPRLIFNSAKKTIRLNYPAARAINAKYIAYSLNQNDNEFLFMKCSRTTPQSLKVHRSCGSILTDRSFVEIMENCDIVKRNNGNGIFYFEVCKKTRNSICFDLRKGYLAEPGNQQQIFIDL